MSATEHDPLVFRSLDDPEPKWRNRDMAARHEWRLARAAALQEREFYEFISGPYAGPDECYFIGFTDDDGDGLVKIGFSNCVGRRLGQLRATSGPYRLNLLARCGGGRDAESHYHRKFEAHAVGGEWFTRCPEIEAEIGRLNEVVA